MSTYLFSLHKRQHHLNIFNSFYYLSYLLSCEIRKFRNFILQNMLPECFITKLYSHCCHQINIYILSNRKCKFISSHPLANTHQRSASHCIFLFHTWYSNIETFLSFFAAAHKFTSLPKTFIAFYFRFSLTLSSTVFRPTVKVCICEEDKTFHASPATLIHKKVMKIRNFIVNNPAWQSFQDKKLFFQSNSLTNILKATSHSLNLLMPLQCLAFDLSNRAGKEL